MYRRSSARRRGTTVVLAATVAALGLSTVPATVASVDGPLPASVSSQATDAAATPVTFPPNRSGQAPCPEGRSRSGTTYVQGFEGSLPEPRFNTGFARHAGGTAGSYSVRSYLPGVSGQAEHFFLPYRQVSVGRSTFLGFTTRGTSVARARVAVNSVLTTFTTGSSWRGVAVDVTPATSDESGWLGTWFEHRATSGRATSVQVDQAEVYHCRSNSTARVAGADRYATAARIADAFPAGVPTAYVAAGGAFPDALSGAAVAGSTGTPVLLVRTGSVPAATAQALQRLDPDRIVVLGGTTAVSDAVAQALEAYAPSVERVGGEDRYGTSALVAQHFAPGVATAYVATGENFPDALAGGALAAHRDSPVLLVRRTSLPATVREELVRLQPRQVVVLGGPSAVSDAVAAELAGYATGSTPLRRLGGDDRYAVAAAVAAEFGTPSASYLATGTGFADAVTGGALAGARGAPLLLARPDHLPDVVRSRLAATADLTGTVLGGTSSLQPIVRDQYGRTLPWAGGS
ncbi:cell wall-binding repeat-containing protein [Ornithinimicrobium sediminis]|uniref:cell wall-binding repeat-containing protein n=1 Tax=Ornithinimicrobium sediminis TaxID=2904603 RepID=UPI001E43B5FE|nr:cell wall-binding repeat-containing protein [Ornithinimicrobium sediminis]